MRLSCVSSPRRQVSRRLRGLLSATLLLGCATIPATAAEPAPKPAAQETANPAPAQAAQAPAAPAPAWKVSTDFEGASAKVVEIDSAAGIVRIRPGGDAKRGWPCWWYFKLDGATAGQTITLEIEASEDVIRTEGPYLNRPLPVDWALPAAAAVSWDGKPWRRGAAGERIGLRMRYAVPVEGTSVRLAWGPPFTPQDAQALVDELARKPGVKAFELARSTEGRPCPAIEVREGDKPDSERPHLWIQARQHAWEAGSSWVGRGFAEWLCGDEPAAAELRRSAKIVFVPIMDIDNTATGNGGKEAVPADHNRDWSEKPVWPEVAAAQKHLAAWAADGRLDVFCDLHNPGYSDKKSSFYVNPEEILAPPAKDNLAFFLTLCEAKFRGAIPYDPAPRRTGANYHPLWKRISKCWAQIHGNPQTLSVTLETAWNAHEADGFRETGANLGRALAEYLKQRPGKLSSLGVGEGR